MGIVVNCLFSGRLPKEGENSEDCQDEFVINDDTRTYALADGASQSFYAGIWANLLTKRFVSDSGITEGNWREWLDPVQSEWLELVKERAAAACESKIHTWPEIHNQLTCLTPATSTFLGVQFYDNDNYLDVSIIGDSCLFIFQNGNLSHSYPCQSSHEFDDRPAYFASYSKNNDYSPQILHIQLDFSSSESIDIIMATDALSEYIFKCIEQRKNIYSDLQRVINKQEEFSAFVQVARENKEIKMKNDDVALIVLRCFPSLSNFNRNVKSTHRNDSGLCQISSATFEDCLPTSNFCPTPPDRNSHPTSITEQEKNQINNKRVEANLKRHITNLQYQRFLLVLCLVIFPPSLSIWMRVNSNTFMDQSMMQSTVPAFKELKKGSRIYADQGLQSLLVDTLSNSLEVIVIEEGRTWIKFQVDLYVYESAINDCPNCSQGYLEIMTGKNIRTFPSSSDASPDIFGKLVQSGRFQKLQFSSIPSWHKFRFTGYLQK